MADKLTEIRNTLAASKGDIRKRYPIKSLGVFGSYARGEAGRSSDLDILVEFSRPIGMFAFLRLEDELKKLLGVKVDLVTKKALKPGIGKRILKEVVKV